MDSLPPQSHGCKPDDAPSRCSAPALVNAILQLDAEGNGRVLSACADSAEETEFHRRFHAWLRGAAVDTLLAGVEREGAGR